MSNNAAKIFFWVLILGVVGFIGYLLYDDFYGVNPPVVSKEKSTFSTHLLLNNKVKSIRVDLGVLDKEARSWDLQLAWKDAEPKLEMAHEFASRSILKDRRLKTKGYIFEKQPVPVQFHANYILSGEAPTLTLTQGENNYVIDLLALDKGVKVTAMNGNIVATSAPVSVPIQSDTNLIQASPFIFQAKDGRTFVTYRQFSEGLPINYENIRSGSFHELNKIDEGMNICLSEFNGAAFLPVDRITTEVGNYSNPIVLFTGKKQFVLWMELKDSAFNINLQERGEIEIKQTDSKRWESWKEKKTLYTAECYGWGLTGTVDAAGNTWLFWMQRKDGTASVHGMVLDNVRHPFSNPRELEELRPAAGTTLSLTSTTDNVVLGLDHESGEKIIPVIATIKDLPTPKVWPLPESGSVSRLVSDYKSEVWFVLAQSSEAEKTNPLLIPGVRQLRVGKFDISTGSFSLAPQLPIDAAVHHIRQPNLALLNGKQPVLVYQISDKAPSPFWSYRTTTCTSKGWTSPEPLGLSPEIHPMGSGVVGMVQGDLLGITSTGSIKPYLECWRKVVPASDAAISLTKWEASKETSKAARNEVLDLLTKQRMQTRGAPMRWLRGAIFATPVTPQDRQNLEELLHWAYREKRFDWVAFCEPHIDSSFRWRNAMEKLELYSAHNTFTTLRGSIRDSDQSKLMLFNLAKADRPLPTAQQVLGFIGGNAVDKTAAKLLDEKLLNDYLIRSGILALDWTEEMQVPIAQRERLTDSKLASEVRSIWKPSWDNEGVNLPYAQVTLLSTNRDEGSIMDAIKSNHYYVSTSEIFLNFDCGTGIMGDRVSTILQPKFQVTAQANEAIKEVQLYRDETMIGVKKGSGKAFVGEFKIEDLPVLKPHHFFVKVILNDGNQAISQPIRMQRSP